MQSIAEHLWSIKERIRGACARVGRNPDEVRVVGVTKTVPIERIREGVLSGVAILGENYVQEARGKV
ncbi:MAG: YggS family pyridoxal phosphate-dependent enzyme, partial [Syntrophobacteraceae bacterium]|nr:YggS family pyridoxal phosphate-dependent enzyme [Syntrophobacteraceae bacterium]